MNLIDRTIDHLEYLSNHALPQRREIIKQQIAFLQQAKVHELKTLSNYFYALEKGDKTFEVRKYDRPFEVGDVLILKEYDLNLGYSGDELLRVVTYLMREPQCYMPKGHCIMAIKELRFVDVSTLEVKANGS